MCLNRQGKLHRSNLIFKDTLLEDVNTFLYLGFLISSNGNVLKGLKNLEERASKAFYKLRSAMGTCFFRDIQTAFKLFGSLIKPILLYASDFWGFTYVNTNGKSPVDTLHSKFCKWMLGLSKRASSLGALRELERFPISIEGQIHYLNNFVRIIGKKCCNELILKSYSFSVSCNLRLIDQLKSHLNKCGFGFFFENVGNINVKR